MTVKWLFWSLSSEKADFLFALFNWVSVLGAFTVFVGVFLVFLITPVREVFSAGKVADAAKAASDAAAAAYSAGETAGSAQAGLVAAQAKIKSAEKNIAEANERAAEATRDAARLGVRIEELPTFVAKKEAQLTKLAEAMTRSGAELDRARQAAQSSQAKAEAALDALRKESGSRTLTKNQSEKIAASLRGRAFSPVFVQSDPGDVEAYPYAMQILSALTSAGLRAEYQPWPTTFMWFNEPGVFVVTSGNVPKEQSEALRDALNAAGVDAKEAQTSGDMSPKAPLPGRLSVVVWRHPPPKAAASE
jgi:hypothetical protein